MLQKIFIYCCISLIDNLFILENVLQVGWDVWLKATTSRQTKATLSELIEGSEYKFRVKAENPYGMSEPSQESDVIFIPDLKRGYINSLNF